MQDITYYGASPSNTAALNTLFINNAILSEPYIIVPPGDFQVNDLTNPIGKPWLNQGGRVMKGTQQLNTTTDDNQTIFGREYLHAVRVKLLDRTDKLKVVWAGDSTTENWGQGHYMMSNVFARVAADKGHSVDSINMGVGGAYNDQWLSTYLDQQLAQNPDLMVIRWGINDASTGHTIEQYATSLRAGLAKIRATRPVNNLSIILMTPNTAASDGGRDEAWIEKCKPVVRKAARDFNCCFIDTYSIWADARSGTNIWLDSYTLHPLWHMNVSIASMIADVVFESGLRTNLAPALHIGVSPSHAPSTYPLGWSLYAGFDWGDGLTDSPRVLTFRDYDGFVSQKIFIGVSRTVAERNGNANSNIWQAFITKPATNLTPKSGWTSIIQPQAYISNNVVTLSGFIQSGTRSDGTVLVTLPVGLRPKSAFICAKASMEKYGVGIAECYLKIESNGNVTAWSGVSQGTSWISFDGISFESGN